MTRLHLHLERHLASRIGWLCAAVLGASDGIVSTASLIIGVRAGGANFGAAKLRATLWDAPAVAVAVAAGIGNLVGTAV